MAKSTKVGYRVNAWLEEVGFGRSKYYTLPPELKPRTVDVDGMTLVVEQPVDYLQRVGGASIAPETASAEKNQPITRGR